MLPLVSLGLALTSCADRPTVRENADGPRIQLAEKIVQDAIDSNLVPGAVLLVSLDGAVTPHQAFGYANGYDFDGKSLTDPDKMTAGHVFDLASLTKVFATTFGIMILVDRDVVRLDSPLHEYLPEFRGVSKDSITVRHLLTHTAGLSPWKPTYFHAQSAAESYEYIRSLPLDYTVGDGRHYSDLGFMLLGYLIERVSGSPVDQFIETELYEPLGLSATSFASRANITEPVAATSQGNPFERRMIEDPDFGYLINENPNSFTEWRQYTLTGEVNDGNSYYAHGGVAGHAGLFSTAGDLNVLINLLLNKGVFDGNEIISADIIGEFLSPDFTGNGLGWAMSANVLPVDHMPPGAFGHTGFTGTYVFADPESKLVVILLTNRQNSGVDENGNYPSLSALRRAVVNAAFDQIPRIEN